jgi:hypothetical protein
MINYDGRLFRKPDDPRPDSPVVRYNQDGDLVWANFAGGRVRRGSMTGTCADDGTLDFAYSMVLASGEVISGRCVSTPQFLPGGYLRLQEQWERYGRHAATGISYLEEVPR